MSSTPCSSSISHCRTSYILPSCQSVLPPKMKYERRLLGGYLELIHSIVMPNAYTTFSLIISEMGFSKSIIYLAEFFQIFRSLVKKWSNSVFCKIYLGYIFTLVEAFFYNDTTMQFVKFMVQARKLGKCMRRSNFFSDFNRFSNFRYQMPGAAFRENLKVIVNQTKSCRPWKLCKNSL